MKIKVLKQRDGNACGPTCIKMIADYFKTKHSVSTIARISKYKKQGGLTNEGLTSTLEKLSFKVTTKANASWDDLKKYNKKNRIVILSWMLKGYIGHFSLLQTVDNQYIYLADPEKGKTIKLPKGVFLRLWLDYDGLWYPIKNTDIQLRWLAVVSR